MVEPSSVTSLAGHVAHCIIAPPACVAACRVAAHASCHEPVSQYNPAAKLPPITIQYIVSQHNPPARPRERALQVVSRLPLSRIAGPPRPYRGRGWPCHGLAPCSLALPSLVVSRYNQLYRDPPPNIGSSPSDCLFEQNFFFFSHHFFFISSSLLATL